jgi:hypothetical protein
MRLVFIDDSEQSNPPRRGLGPLVAIGAVIIDESQLAPFSGRLRAIRSRIGIPSDEELKWKPAKGSFLRSAGGEAVTDLRRSMLVAAKECDVRSAVVVLDHGAAYRSLSTAEAGLKVLAWLYERIEMSLTDYQDLGVVLADQPGGGAKAEKHWLTETLDLTSNGTQHVNAERVVMPIVTAPSDHVPHLQLADLVTAATTAAVAGRKSGLDLVPLLRELAHTRLTGETGGAGIVLWPKELYDLHWWVFGEEYYRRGSVGFPLGPHDPSAVGPLSKAGRPYLKDDGLGVP